MHAESLARLGCYSYFVSEQQVYIFTSPESLADVTDTPQTLDLLRKEFPVLITCIHPDTN